MMNEIPEVRWPLIRKVYSIVALMLLATFLIGAFCVVFRPAYTKYDTTTQGIVAFFIFMALTFYAFLRLYSDRNRSFVETFIHCVSCVNDLVCASASDKIILEAIKWAAAVVVVLTLYTFWSSMRGQDFRILSLILFGYRLVLLVLVIVFGMIQFIFCPLGNWFAVIFCCLDVILFCGFFVYNTDKLIQRCSVDECFCVSTSLYLEIIHLFLALLWVFEVFDAD